MEFSQWHLSVLLLEEGGGKAGRGADMDYKLEFTDFIVLCILLKR